MVLPDRARTYVMAYWPIPGNAKRSLDHYTEHLAQSLAMLAGQKLHFISGNNNVLASVESMCRAHGITLHVEKRVLDEQAHSLITLWWNRIIPHRSYVKGWKISPSHYINQDLANVWLDK